MTIRARTGKATPSTITEARKFVRAPIAQAVALALAAGTLVAPVYAQQAFSPAWFAQKGAAQANAAATGQLPNGQPIPGLSGPQQQSQAARDQLQQSMTNLGNAAQAIALQQSLQQQARAAALVRASSVPDGLGQGGLKIDEDTLTRGWINANAPVQSTKDGRVVVDIEQTADKAILNWETFNVGRNTTVNFGQDASWSVLNRVNDPNLRPSEIQGRINAPGTVFILNRNGILFDGASQVNVRSLVAAAVGMTDAQFRKGLFSDAQGTGHIPTFANDLQTTASSFRHGAAEGRVIVEEGARIKAHVPTSVTEGGGYVMLLGGEVHNAGHITTTNGQTVLAAGDAFVIRRGLATDENQNSTTRGNVVGTLRLPGTSGEDGETLANPAGLVRNSGLIEADTGDITLAGHDVHQDGTLKATTSVHTRGTIHLVGDRSSADSQVTLGEGSTTAIVLDETATTALDVQRETLVSESDIEGDGIQHRRDQSLVQILSGGDVTFEGDSLTLATSGQVFVDAAGTSDVQADARIDVSGHVGVRIAMEANNVEINVQGFEQRDAPVNRDGDDLRNTNLWLDRRDLVLVPAGTNGYETDRWYTAGGLLEVGGYLGITGHGIGEWSAQGGTVQFAGANLVTRAGSSINLSGGTLDVQTGHVNQTWLKGGDGKLYSASNAPGDLLYSGLYRGFEAHHARWGSNTTEYFYNPLIAPVSRLENGYTVGRDAGRLVVSTRAATLDGDIETAAYQGERQTDARDAHFDGYQQSQTAVARRGELVIGDWKAVYDTDSRSLRYSQDARVDEVVIGTVATAPVDGGDPEGDDDIAAPTRIVLDSEWLSDLELGAVRAHARGSVEVNRALTVAMGGEVALHATQVDVGADITARGGRIALGDVVERHASNTTGWQDVRVVGQTPEGYEARTVIGEGVNLDTRGVWNNLQRDPDDIAGLPYIDGGDIDVRSSGTVQLAAGASLDVSSGATLRADDRLDGGRGGNITLAADALPFGSDAGGRLLLEGELRGHGVAGGGTLRLQTGDAVVIGGQVAGSDGVLQAGEVSQVDLFTSEAFTVAEGAVLPIDYRYIRTRAQGGEALGAEPLVTTQDPGSWVTIEAPMALPKPAEGQWYAISTTGGSSYSVQGYSWSPVYTLPAGTVITHITNPQNFPAGYVVDGAAVPGGIPIVPTEGVQKAGTIAAADLRYEAGSRIMAGERLPQSVAVVAPLHLDNATFSRGFSRYEVVAGNGLAVPDGADVQIAMPVLRVDPTTARSVATGADPGEALDTWLPPLFLEDAAGAQLTRRRGADLMLSAGGLRSTRQNVYTPTLNIAATAQLAVDPGSAIEIYGNGQINIDGTLHAAGGRISIRGLGFQDEDLGRRDGHDGSIWIGEQALLDVSGIAHSAIDALGRRYGQVLDGGRIEIGGLHSPFQTQSEAVDNFVVIRPGAQLDASGAAATLDLPGLGATLLASDGGVIHLASFNGLFLDGDLRAESGGASAAGGTLSVALETPNVKGAGDRVLAARELHLVAERGESALSTDLQPGQADDALVIGRARVGVDQIEAGGFDDVSLLVNGLMTLHGGVDLGLGRSLGLVALAYGLPEDASEGDEVLLHAPYVRLSSATKPTRDTYTKPAVALRIPVDGKPEVLADTRLRIDAGVLDLQNQLHFGAYGNSMQADTGIIRRDGFDMLELRSRSDLRFLAPTISDRTSLTTEGDLTLAGSQIYPATNARVEVMAGRTGSLDAWGNFQVFYDPARILRIERSGDGPLPVQPYSAFGTLSLLSANIEQGGVLRAPLGSIQLGFGLSNDYDAQQPGRIVLLPGSTTSVSGAGLVMPYGGTVDGLTYTYDGADAYYRGLGALAGQIGLYANEVEVQEGASVDLSGGGDLKGAGFLTGRGGSTDTRLDPLVQIDPAGGGFVLPGRTTNPVYAIVPGEQAALAPIAVENGAGDPAIGQQITIGDGVPGLPAGTYTLLPSTYALMPGAYRVELNGLASSAAAFGSTTAMRNGSWTTAARLGVAGTAIADVQTTQAVLTSGDTVRRYSQYNETGYAQFGIDWATRDGVPRPQLERDAKQLDFNVATRLEVAPGSVDLTAAEGGRSGTAIIGGKRIEILADGSAPTEGFDGVSIHVGTLNGLGAGNLSIGAVPSSVFSSDAFSGTSNAWRVSLGAGTTDEIILRQGAVLQAAQVFLAVSNRNQGLIVEQGAGIDTIGQGAAPWDSREGFVLVPGNNGVLALSNGWLDVMPSSDDQSWGVIGAGYLHIGTCAEGATCSGDTRLYSEGTITAATNKSFLLGDSVRYGTRNLVLSMGGINVGSSESLAQAEADGVLQDGLTLNQSVLDRLLLGDTSTGAPALENLVLTARDAVSFFGTVDLTTLDPVTGRSALERLVLTAPAFYGYGSDTDVARIETDVLVWNGGRNAPGDIMAAGAGTGSGRLVVDARQIEFGYGPKSQPNTVASHERTAVGFASVVLDASERVTANHKGSLSVYAARDGWDAASGNWLYSGGDLEIRAPLLTGDAGSVNHLRAGGDIRVTGVAGVAAPAVDGSALGAELSLDAGRALVLDTTVALPSGKLVLSADDDVTLEDDAVLDMAGRKVAFFDVDKYGWGGDVLLESRGGDVVQQAGSTIDLSAEHNRAGTMSTRALDGTVALAGAIAGRSSGTHDAGGTQVPFAAGRIDVRGRHIDDFDGLNTRLNTGGVSGGRSFQLGEGDLVIGDALQAREIDVSVDNGSLTVTGTIDASGAQAGSIRLAANGGLTLAGTAVLDASARTLRKDSYGQIIEAPNRAVIELDSGDGRLVLADGARMDLRVDGAPQAYGTVALNAPRIGGATGSDIAIDAAGVLDIAGARAISLNAFHRYDDARTGTDPGVDGRSYQVVDQAYLDAKHADSIAFIDNALANGELMDVRLQGLRRHAAQFRLRPGVEIVSDAAVNPDGDLHVDGDLDLSGHRYASLDAATPLTGVHGSGEAGALVLRAAGDLAIFGSINDGFDTTAYGATGDDNGWVLPAGRMPFGGDLTIPHGGMVTLDTGTVFAVGRTLNYDLPVAGLNLPAGTVLPVAMPLSQSLTLPAGTVLGVPVLDAAGNVLHAAGTLLHEALVIEAGQQLAAGFRLPSAVSLAATVWPKGVPLPVSMTLAAPLALAKGAIVPSETDVVLPDGATMVDLRPVDADGNHGRNFAVAPMLAAGSRSWDLRAVAGADLAAADARTLLAGSTGSLRLADTHFGLGGVEAVSYRVADDASAELLEMLEMYYGIVWEPGHVITPEEGQWLLDNYLISTDPLEFNSMGYGEAIHWLSSEFQFKPARQQLYSVLRTGTGDLDLLAAGDVDMRSLYGVYTAGTAVAAPGAGFERERARLTDGTVLRPSGAYLESLVDGGADSLYRAWYPEQGGNVLLRAGGHLTGDLVGDNNGVNDSFYTFANSRQQLSTVAVGNWLWRQGTGSVADGDDAVPTAWWINFGSYIAGSANGSVGDPRSNLFINDPFLVGFTGVGTLGGGNLVVEGAGDAGMRALRGQSSLWNGSQHTPRSQGLHLAVASTGRVSADGTLLQTGGGDLDVRLGGTLNPDPATRLNNHDLNSTFVNLRGATGIRAGAIGGIQLNYGALDQMDSRPASPFYAGAGTATGGPILVLGDSAVRIETRGDLVLGGVSDPTRTTLLTASSFSYDGVDYTGNGWNWFSMWTPATAIDLLSAGGNLTPTTVWDGSSTEDTRWNRDGLNHSANNDGYFYPSILRAAAANGSIFYGKSASAATIPSASRVRYAYGVTLAPAPMDAAFVNTTGKGELQLLAQGSIHAGGFPIAASSADPAGLSSVMRPGFLGILSTPQQGGLRTVHNASGDAVNFNDWITYELYGTIQFASDGGRGNVAPLFAFGTPATSAFATPGRAPARYYAVDGDIIGLRLGQEVELGFPAGTQPSRFEGSIPVAVRAGRDITDSGTPLGQKDTVAGRKTSVGDTVGNLVSHAFADDISVVEAGRDVRSSSFYVTGPGLLEVSAGRDVYLADKGEFKSLGPIVNVIPGDRGSGAGISVSAGMGEGAHWDAFADRYLDPDNQADLVMPFADQPGKALTIYSGEMDMATWLQREFGYSGDEAGAPAFLAQKQAELDAVRQQALAEGRSAANRSLQREYTVESQLYLVNWLQTRFGGRNGLDLQFDAATTDARAFFAALPQEQRRAYLRDVYYAELRAGGREYNNPESGRFNSYLRGREAIATLFPEQDADGNALTYEGDLTMFSSALYFNADIVNNQAPRARPTPGIDYLTRDEWDALGNPMYGASYFDVLDAGIHTAFGGDISILTPGGRTLVGVDGGFNPGPGSGVITQGEGDISIYALDDILMGQSRIFTTFGGNILAWSAQGDINAGRGSKTTVVYTPQRRVYDSVGNVSLSPNAPSTGAGIATLNPLPEIPPGDIDLLAPLGTIDAGEAGIRVSGQVNLAALQVLNAENIQVQGEATGLPVIAAVNIGALTSASAAANSAVQAAQDMVQRQTQQARPSVISVEVLGFGGAPSASTGQREDASDDVVRTSYDPTNPVQFIAIDAQLDPATVARLTPAQRALLQQE